MMIGRNNKGYAAALVMGQSEPTQKELKTNMGRLQVSRPAPLPPSGRPPKVPIVKPPTYSPKVPGLPPRVPTKPPCVPVTPPPPPPPPHRFTN